MSWLLKWGLILAAIAGGLAYDYQLGRNHEYPIAYSAGEKHGAATQKSTDDTVASALVTANDLRVKAETAQGLKDSHASEARLSANITAALSDAAVAHRDVGRLRDQLTASRHIMHPISPAAGQSPAGGGLVGAGADRCALAVLDLDDILADARETITVLLGRDAEWRARDDQLRRIYP